MVCSALALLCAVAAFAQGRMIQGICLVGILLVLLSFVFDVFSLLPM